jgi:hypothetical protein
MRGAVLVGLLFAAATARAAEGARACLARFYAIPAGIPDDLGARSFAERLARPALADVVALPYRAGAIRPVTEVDDDPGRVRVDALFAATYPKAGLVKVRFLERTLTVHGKAAGAFSRVAARLVRARRDDPGLAPFLEQLGGTFVARNIAGTDRRSAHSYGISIDLNPARGHYWRWQRPTSPSRWQNQVPQAIVDAFEAERFIWGGRWYHYDTMHFEYRPELFDPACAPTPAAAHASDARAQ